MIFAILLLDSTFCKRFVNKGNLTFELVALNKETGFDEKCFIDFCDREKEAHISLQQY